MRSAAVKVNGSADLKERARDVTDEDLLEQFLTGKEVSSQEAFRALVLRHGPMVLGVCRHLLDRHEDAEDAFQATFLVLVRKAGSIRDRRVLAGWLHEVAHRIAIKARANGVRLRNLERQGGAMLPPSFEPKDPHHSAAWNELRAVLHAEVERLPERYRIPVILSYLEGKTNEEVAALLRWPVGTVKGRLSRAREMLRSRLLRRGLCLSAAFLITAFRDGTLFAEEVPAELLTRTLHLARKFGPGAGLPMRGSSSQVQYSTGTTASLGASPIEKKPRKRRFIGRALCFFLLMVICSSISVGVGLALAGGGDLSELRAVLSVLIPLRAHGGIGPPPCH